MRTHLIEIIIIGMIALAFFSGYKVWVLEKDKYIMESDIIYETPSKLSELKVAGEWADIIVIVKTDE